MVESSIPVLNGRDLQVVMNKHADRKSRQGTPRSSENGAAPAVCCELEIDDRQEALKLPHERLRLAVVAVLRQEGVTEAEISLSLVDDAEMRRLNHQFLAHDYPTDVLSFVYATAPLLEGELIIGAERAVHVSREKGTPPEDELLWYIIHGTLHLTGYDDGTEAERRLMRTREAAAIKTLGCMWPLEKEDG